jgi:hypothetical protein
MYKPFVGISVKKFIECVNKNSKLKDFDVIFIKDNKVVREIVPMENYKVGAPIKVSEAEFIKNGYEQLLNNKITNVYYPYDGETKSMNVSIE